MGKIKNNVVTQGFSGKFGEDIMFRQVHNKTIFVKRSAVKARPSAKQIAVKVKFAEAAYFAAAAMDNPQARYEYQLAEERQNLKTAYVAAVTDYLTLPEIGGIFAPAYNGKVGDAINIKTKAPGKVTEIDVSIMQADGTLLESGKAVVDELKWTYIATAVNAVVKRSTVVITARDRRGQQTTAEYVL